MLDLQERRLIDFFLIRTGDFHATHELDSGTIPLISCGDENNGLVGFFDVPMEQTYENCITVAYNGSPLTARFHPYRFGAKDDVAVLVPRTTMRDRSLIYVAAILNRMTWRYNYGRKCFRGKLEHVSLLMPLRTDGTGGINEDAVSKFFPTDLRSRILAPLNGLGHF